MKFVLLLVFVGLASANIRHSILRSVTKDIEHKFQDGVDEVYPLHIALGVPRSSEIEDVENELKKDIGDSLKETLDTILEKIKDRIDHGHNVAHNLLEQVSEVTKKLKDLHIDVGNKAKALWEDIGDKLGNLFKRIKDFFNGGDKRKRGIGNYVTELIQSIDVRSILLHIKEMLLEKLDTHIIQKYLHKVLDKDSALGEYLTGLIKDKSDGLLQNVIERLLREPISEVAAAPSVSDVLEKGKGLLKDVKDELKSRLNNFLNWINVSIENGTARAKEAIERLKEVTEQFLRDSKELTREAILSALEDLSAYKEQLGSKWDEILEDVREILPKLSA